MTRGKVKKPSGEVFIRSAIVQDKPKGRGFQLTVPKEAAQRLTLKADEKAQVFVHPTRGWIIYKLVRPK